MMADEILEYWMSLARELASRFNVDEFDTSSAFWSWDNIKDDIRPLRGRLGVENDYVEFLGYHVDFESGETTDTLAGVSGKTSKLVPFLYYYNKAKDVGISDVWEKFSALKGSWACRHSFDEQDLETLRMKYVEDKEKLFQTLEKLGGVKADHGDDAYVLSFLPMVKVLLVFEEEDEEFPATVRLLFDKNSIFYEPHEMLGSVGWMLASRVAIAG